MAREAAILGASGLVGRYCLEALLSSREFEKVTALNRRGLPDLKHPKLTQRVANLWELAPSDFDGFTDLFCALGTTIAKAGSQQEFRRVDHDLPLNIAKAAVSSGVQRFVLVSSIGADPASKNFYLRTKGELEQDLSVLGFQGLYIFRPSLLLGRRQEVRPLEIVAIRFAPALNLVLWGALKRYRPVAARNVGRAMVAAAETTVPGTFIYTYKEILRLVDQSR